MTTYPDPADNNWEPSIAEIRQHNIDKLRKVISTFEAAATHLSMTLENFKLSGIPHCEQDLNKTDIGSKVKAAKFILEILETDNVL